MSKRAWYATNYSVLAIVFVGSLGLGYWLHGSGLPMLVRVALDFFLMFMVFWSFMRVPSYREYLDSARHRTRRLR